MGMLASLDLDALDFLGWVPVGPAQGGVLLMLPGFGSGLQAEKKRSAEICRAQKHCHLLTCPGTQLWTLPCCPSPFANGPGHGTPAATLVGLTSPRPAAGQERGRTALPRHGCGRARRLAPTCSTSSCGRRGGGRAPTVVLQALSLLTSREMMEVTLLILKELTNFYPAAKSDFKAASSTAASCRQRGQVLVITASDARAAKYLGKCALGCKKRF